jgi:hypothetical protein
MKQLQDTIIRTSIGTYHLMVLILHLLKFKLEKNSFLYVKKGFSSSAKDDIAWDAGGNWSNGSGKGCQPVVCEIPDDVTHGILAETEHMTDKQ